MPSPIIRRFILASTFLGVLLPLLSCSSDDADPVVPPGDTLLAASGTIGPAGGSLMSGDGRLVLTVPAGALAADTEIVITEVAAKDLTATAEGMQVIHAFTLEPANLELAVPMTLELRSEDYEAGSPGKDAEVGPEIPLPVALAGATEEGGETYRAFLEQELTIGSATQGWLMAMVLSLIPQDLVLGFIYGALDGLPGTTYVAVGQELPAQPIANTQFNAQVAFFYSAALTLGSDIRYGPVILQNLQTLLEEGDPLSFQELIDPGGLHRAQALLSYVAGIPGPATWDLALRAEFDFLADLAFPTSENLPRIWGTFKLLFLYAPVSLAIQEVSGGENELLPGLYEIASLAEAGFPIRKLEGFPYNNTLSVSHGNGTTIYSLDGDLGPTERFPGFVIPTLLIYGNILMSYPQLFDEKAFDPASIAMVQFGPGGARLTQWFPEDNAFGLTGILEFQSSVTDAYPFDGDPRSGGFVYVAGLYNAVRLIEYNPESGFWDIFRQINNFPEAPGAPFSAAHRPGAGALVVTEGSPGKIYHHDLANTFDPAVAVGDAGNSPRRIRTAGDLAFISNFESDDITILSWSSGGTVSVVGSVPVGDGPVGIDALELAGGNVAVVSTGFNDNSSTVTIVDAAGSVISSTTTDLPAGAVAPGHAFWLRGEATHYGVTCNGSGHLVVIDPGLD